MAKIYNQELIYKLCDYPPYRKLGEINPDTTNDTYRVMDLKNPEAPNHNKAVKHFGEGFAAGTVRIADSLDVDKVQIAIVPSSEKGKRSEGLEAIVKLAVGVKAVYDPLFLNRDVTVSKSHLGGDRSLEKHINSISVHNTPKADIPLILLDDVTTTGKTMNACAQILKDAGVNNIFKVAIGKTI